ncbi:MAG: FAD-binding oxidoreductase [Phototrophicaceae bacterium]|jgi:FAD/FMN-containing dehydrogenase
MARYASWARYPKAQSQKIQRITWRHKLPNLSAIEGSVLPFGYGRSYGDSCLNNGGTLLDVTDLNRMIAFDRERGVIRAEAGVSLKDILDLVVPAGWFIPVSPGTKFVSVGGAIANDVHGKNHHISGTFGCHVTQLELLRSDGSRCICSPTQNTELFGATIGGLGLTGLITWAEFTLKRIPSPYVDVENIQFTSIDEFFRLSRESQHIPYTVSWLDCTATGKQFGRGVFQRGDFFDPPLQAEKPPTSLPAIPVPFDFPDITINPLTIQAFNLLYFHKQILPYQRTVNHYNPFFYPLDVALDWYRLYGRRGFFQYQFVVPYDETVAPVKEVFRQVVRSGQASPLIVFKTFGEMRSPGMLSFPRPGVTLAIDFPNRGQDTLRLLDQLDQIVMAAGGALYPAKDARMSGDTFRRSYPNWEAFAQYIDPKFSSSFWRRVTA